MDFKVQWDRQDLESESESPSKERLRLRAKTRTPGDSNSWLHTPAWNAAQMKRDQLAISQYCTETSPGAILIYWLRLASLQLQLSCNMEFSSYFH